MAEEKKTKRLVYKAKGEVGYIESKKRYELLMAIFILIVAAAIFVLGLALNKWEKGNIFTIIAAIFIIPMARFASTYVMFFPFKSVSQEKADEVAAHAKAGSIVYSDVIITSEKKAMNLAFVVITGDKVLAITGRDKEDVYDIRNYLQDIYKRRGYDYKVTVTDEYVKFFNLLKSSDCVAEKKFDNEEEREYFNKQRAEVCEILESLMP